MPHELGSLKALAQKQILRAQSQKRGEVVVNDVFIS
jgi:hypothetical protein